MQAIPSTGMSGGGDADDVDDGPRALLTAKERRILLGEVEVSDKYYYNVVYRVRQRMEKLRLDIEAMEAHDSLADEAREIFCEPEDQDEGEDG